MCITLMRRNAAMNCCPAICSAVINSPVLVLIDPAMNCQAISGSVLPPILWYINSGGMVESCESLTNVWHYKNRIRGLRCKGEARVNRCAVG